MRMIRSFNAVGQGAFYTEKFECENGDLNIVYDCGTASIKSILKERIKERFKKEEKIDAVIISHFDADHINGLEFLISYCDVRRIYFPLLSDEQKMFFKVLFLCDNVEGFVKEFFENPRVAVNNVISNNGISRDNQPQIIGIRQYSEENPEREFNENEKDSGYNLANDFSSGTKGELNKFLEEWVFIPFNLNQEIRIGEFLKELENTFSKPITLDELDKLWKDNLDDARRKIREAYDKVDGRNYRNTYSMILYSGLKDNYLRFLSRVHLYKGYFTLFKCPYCYIFSKLGCLYTGDFNASTQENWDKLQSSYAPYWKNIGCVQIPHHGSKKDFNDDIMEICNLFVISSGTNNSYGHPDGNILRKILLRNRFLFVVTEDIKSEVNMVIKFGIKYKNNGMKYYLN